MSNVRIMGNGYKGFFYTQAFGEMTVASFLLTSDALFVNSVQGN